MKAKLTRGMLRLLMRLDNLLYSQISRFALIAEGGIHPKHRLMDYHRFFVNNVSPGDSVLDIGCGNGFLSYDVAGKAAKVTAIDLNQSNIEFASKNFRKDNIEYLCGDATSTDFKGKFDVIILSNLLEHLEDREGFLKKVRQLSPRFLVRVPVADRDWLVYYKRELGVEYRLDLTHHVEYTLESFRQELEKAGLKLSETSVQFGEIWAVVGRDKGE